MNTQSSGLENRRDSPEFVFVHLNSTVPNYIWKNISRTKALFPEVKVLLITDQVKNIEQAKRLAISTKFYVPDIEVLQLLNNHVYDTKFRRGFWQSSIIRLFAFLEYAKEADRTIVHLESDILLTSTFPLQRLKKLDKLAWVRFNSIRDVAAIILCPNKGEALWFESELKKLLNQHQDMTDMSLLSCISSTHPRRIALLPIAPFSESRLIREGTALADRNSASLLANEYGGFFDGAPIGMWLNGQDPRNNFGVLRRHLNLVDSHIDTRSLKLQSRQGRLFYHENDQIFELFNLHLHSKIESDFGALWRIRLRYNAFLSRTRFQIVTFAPRKFSEVIREVLYRHGTNPFKLIQLVMKKIW